jgi:hypothetical protein
LFSVAYKELFMALKTKNQTQTSKINYFIDNPAGGCFSIEHVESVSLREHVVVCTDSNNKYIGYIDLSDDDADVEALLFIAQTISTFVKRGEGVPVDFTWDAAFEERDLAALEAEEKSSKGSAKKPSQPSTN